MDKRWRIHPHDSERIADLQKAAKIPAVVAQLLICRGISNADTALSFLDVKLSDLLDPDDLPGASDAADLIFAAVGRNERIVVYGDYDVDGMSGIAVLFRCLELLGADVGYYVPHRIDEGYGLNDEALTTLAERGTRLVVTVDCGAASHHEAETARTLGLTLVITDHHEFSEPVPRADGLVHPRLPGHSYAFPALSGSGVAFKLAWALCRRASEAKKVSPRMKDFLLESIGLASLGTIADVVPLVGENRVIVRHGLASISQRPSIGLAALLKVTELDRKSPLSSEDIAFMIAPRLNAAGRLGQAQLAVELLTTDSAERATALAQYVHQLNGTRQTLERSVYLSARKQAEEKFDPENDAALVLAERGWHPGVIGIVAGRLAEKYHMPVVVLSQDELGVKPAVGSGRSVPGFNLHTALSVCSDHFESFGGHAAAAGVKINDARIDDFRVALCEFAAAEISAQARVSELWIDAEAPLSSFTLKVVNQIEMLAPFGHGNTRPLLCATDVALDEPPRRIGGGGRHLSLRLSQHGVSLRAVAFGEGDRADELASASRPLEIAFRPVINHFRGRRSVELQLADWRVVDSPSDD